MDDIIQDQEPQGLFSKRSSSNILSDPRILAHLRIVAEEAQSSEKDREQDEESELQNTKRELGLKIAAYNKGNQHGAFRLILKEDLGFEGALRFYFEDGKEELTKALRLTNKTLVSELLPTLIEKFKPDLLNSAIEKKAKLYEVYEEDEICLDPSDAPLEIALNAKKLPRFVLRLDYKNPPQTSVVSNGESIVNKTSVANGTALSNRPTNPSFPSPSPSLASTRTAGSDNSSTGSSAGQSQFRNESPVPSKKLFTKSKTPPLAHKTINDKMPSSSRGDKKRNFFSSPRNAFGMFFDGVGNQSDQSSHAANKMARSKHKRKGSLGRLKIKKKGEEKTHTELSTEQMAPGILKVFGDHVSPGSNYKSVRATEMTAADEIVQQALERYSLSREKASDYVLCDVIGYFTKRTGSVKSPEEDADKWITEYARVISDKEKPLVLQQLWKPIGGFSRRFELRKRSETQDLSFFKPRGSVAVMRAASMREACVPPNIKENRRDTGQSEMSHMSSISGEDRLSSIGVEEAGSSGRASMIASPFIAPTDTPYLLLLKGCSNVDDYLYHRLDEQLAVVGHPVHHGESDQAPDIVLFAPDVLPQHCILSKRVESSAPDFEQEDYDVNFAVYLEPSIGADVCVNGAAVSSPTKLNPGDLVSFGKHYYFLFKDPSQVADSSMKLAWVNNLKQFHKLQISQRLQSFRDGNAGSAETNVVDVVGIQDEPSNGLRLSYLAQDEDEMLDMIMNIVDLAGDGYKLSPAYLLIMCIEHSAKYHTELQTRQLLIKMSNAIQTVASEKTAEMSKTIERTTIPEKALEELLPQLRPVVFWMGNCLEMLPYLHANMSQYIKDPSQIAEYGDEALVNADEELLMFLEEVIIYTFQQTVYHLTKVLYIALPAILDTNPFQDTDEDSEKKPQEVETVISIFQTTFDVVKAYSVHQDIIHQLFAYLFFFTNASLFNTLMERGAGGKFYRWAKGAQIRGNLDLLESWAAQVQLQDEANEYLSRLSTAADLLATPKVQLLQADWLTIRRDFPALNPAQVQQILGEYQLGPGKSRPRGWFPPPEEVEPALRTADILLNFSEHPPLKLPTEGFVLDFETGPADQSFYHYLDAVKQAMNPDRSTTESDMTRINGINRVQQPEPEVSHSDVIRTSSLSQSQEHVPDLVVSPASPKPNTPTGKKKEFTFETVMSNSPPSRKENETVGPRDTRSATPVERRDSPPRKQETPPSKPKISDPTANAEVVQGGKRPLARLVSGQNYTVTASYPGNRLEGRDSVGSSAEDSSVVSARALKKKESRNSDAFINEPIDENQNVERRAASPYTNDNSKWVEVTGAVTRDAVNNVDGLSVLPVDDVETNEELALQIAMDPTIETSKEFDERRALQKAKLLSRLRNESDVDIADIPETANGFQAKIEGMRETDDRQDDVFIVELEKGDDGIGLGLIDGLYTPLRSPGIYVRTLVAAGPAMKDGRLRLGDRILAVNGTSLVGADYQSAMQQIRQAGKHLSFLVAKSDIHVAMKITASSC
ncbi:ras-associating and dilute domain-containing protein-like isoform X2 [Oculina patagonica]